MFGANPLYSLVLLVFILATAITVHEFSHAWMAWKLGDPTAKSQGRVSLNPLRHLDPLGTLMVFIAHIGWGKPVPVNPQNFKNPIRDNALVSAAGPLSNLLTAMAMGYPLKFFATHERLYGSAFLTDLFSGFIMISIVLFLFNLLPFKPLDGAGILGFFIPRKHFFKYEKFMEDHVGHFMVFILIDMFIFRQYLGFSIVGMLIIKPAEYIIQFIMLGY